MTDLEALNFVLNNLTHNQWITQIDEGIVYARCAHCDAVKSQHGQRECAAIEAFHVILNMRERLQATKP